MKSKDSFDISLDEVKTLVAIASDHEKEDSIIFKVIVLLLCAKLEHYIKESALEYVESLVKLKLNRSQLPKNFVLEVLGNEINKIQEVSLHKYYDNGLYKSRSDVLSLFWNDSFQLDHIEKSEFFSSLSSNGTNGINDLYKKIGFPNMIDEMKDFTSEVIVLGVASTTTHQIKNVINRVVNMRNNIIHDDASPPITKEDVGLFIDIFIDFAKQANDILENSIEALASSL